VPPEAILDTLELTVEDTAVELLPGTYSLPAGAPDTASRDGELIEDWGVRGGSIAGGRNLDVYEADAFYPESPVEMLPYSQLRRWKFARVLFRPFQYNPVTGELRLVKRTRVTVSFEISGEPAEGGEAGDASVDTLASTLFQNYTSGRAAYSGTAAARSAGQTYDYVIVTSNAVVGGSDYLPTFVAHKQARGHSVRVVTESDYLGVTGQAPNHRAEKIRQWLIQNHVAMGIEYVLLVGDPTPFEKGEGDVPMKLCWPRRGEGSDEESPTDAFYADLTGNWDRDGDGTYGEWNDYALPGGVDFSMEVWVGRIPVYGGDYASLDGILRKIVGYENAGNTGWRRNVLLPMSFGTTAYDNAMLGEQMRSDFLSARGFSSWTQYQQGSGACSLKSAYASDEELRGGSVVRDRWSANPFGIVAWAGHGSATAASVGATGCNDGTLLSIVQNSALDDDFPAFTFQCSCTNGYPENPRNLQYALLRNGGIATVSATRVSWFNAATGYGQFDGSSTNSGIGYEYVDRLTQSMPAGQALFEAKLAVVPDLGGRSSRLMNQFDFNLYGDPSLKIGGCRTNAECDDGRWCNGQERCVSGMCAAGTPVNCNDGNACTEDLCDDSLDRCVASCSAAGPASACCGNAACAEEAVCNAECEDADRDGYGRLASIACRFPEADCDDRDPAVNPGRTEIQDNGIDDDCRPDTPGWGTPSSVLGEAYARPSGAVNHLLLFLAPALVVGLLRARRSGRRGDEG